MIIDFSGKNYLVTGGASGIGAAVVHYLVQHKGKAVIADINDGAGAALVARYPGQLRYLHTDVTQLAHLEAACALAETEFGGLDGAVNSAGIGSLGNVADMPVEQWHKVIDIDLTGVFHACRAVIPLLRKRGGGSIVNIASLSGVRADHGFAAYNAAKAGVINLSRTMGLDHAHENIRTTAVCPGYIATPLTAAAGSIDAIHGEWIQRIPMHRAGTAEDVAQLVVFLLSPAASYITGTEIVIDGGLGSSNNQPNIPGIFAAM
jgi:meso-butanediol dehydrogenase/(S,S)-butanediol dehydrogenase/diacetyl reductase